MGDGFRAVDSSDEEVVGCEVEEFRSLPDQCDAAVLEELEEGEPEPLPEAWTDRANSASGTMMYYSFVTLTTLGYGDIYPVSDAARILGMLEATLGQLYLVILVARLVGLYTSQQMENQRRAPPT